MKNKKGFTLVELLAVIVILAIIAVIATPIVLNMITKARKNAARTSALGYVDAIEYNNGFADVDQPGYTKITGTKQVSELSEIKLKGKRPSSGTVTINEKGTVTRAELCINGYNVTYENNEATVGDKCGGESTSTYTAYQVGDSINYNPVANEACNDPVSTTGKKTGCMKWYVIKASGTNDDKVDVILDHNTTALVAWNSEGTNTEMKEVATQLATDATGWTTGLNPRLITADEVAHIVGADRNDTIKWSSSKGYGTDDIETKSAWIYLDGGRNSDPTVYASGSNGWQKKYANSSTPSNYAWLFDYTNGCRSYGCNEEDSSAYGYWTSSPVSVTSSSAWNVNRNGTLSINNVDDDDPFGVRPVITIDKSNLD